MSLQDLEVLGYDPKELEKLRDEFNVSDESIKYHAAIAYMYGTDQRQKNDGSSPRSNGKLPYVYRERSRKYGATEEMFNELNEKYKLDGPTEILSQGTTSMSDRGTFMEEIRNEAKKAIRN